MQITSDLAVPRFPRCQLCRSSDLHQIHTLEGKQSRLELIYPQFVCGRSNVQECCSSCITAADDNIADLCEDAALKWQYKLDAEHRMLRGELSHIICMSVCHYKKKEPDFQMGPFLLFVNIYQYETRFFAMPRPV